MPAVILIKSFEQSAGRDGEQPLNADLLAENPAFQTLVGDPVHPFGSRWLIAPAKFTVGHPQAALDAVNTHPGPADLVLRLTGVRKAQTLAAANGRAVYIDDCTAPIAAADEPVACTSQVAGCRL